MRNKTIIFDFDGTIANTFNMLTNLYNDIAPKYGCKVVSDEDRILLRDQKPQDILRDYGITRLKMIFLIYEIRKGMHRNIKKIAPIEGMIEAIKELKASGFSLGIMTSNSKKNVSLFLKQNEVISHFDFIYSGKKLFKKAHLLNNLLKKEHIEKKDTIYIGDETRDIEATKKAKIPMIGVNWGFNSRKALEALDPIAVVNSPKKLVEELKNHFNVG